MKHEKKGKRGGKGMIVGSILVFLLFAILLWLSKCTLSGWVLMILVFAGFLFLRLRILNDKAWYFKFAAWAVLFVLFFLVTKIAAPPYKRVPAVTVKNPKETRLLEVKQGKLTGVYNADETVEVYAGIPYAKPPVGDLRWQEPAEPENWEGILKADHFAPMSMQTRSNTIYNSLVDILFYNRFSIGFQDNYLEEMSEDSLYLNIWKPAGEVKDLPVVFYIHGGSLMTGQSSYQAYNGETYAKNGVVFVTIAYRLNVFGYYANEELAKESANGTTGNYGLLDQIQALKWVNENIAVFGGDPDNITIAGESAGSSSVNALCVSPLSKGLFKRAIAESSGITPVVPYHTFRTLEAALKMGKDIMQEFGASSVADLRKIDAEKLVNTRYSNNSMTVDGYAITEQPYLTYEKGENNEEALLNGFNAHEADVFNVLMTGVKPDTIAEILRPVYGSYTEEVTALYPASTNRQAKQSINQILSATWFAYSHYDWDRYLASQKKPVYLYYFYQENKGLSNNHAGELPYVYGNVFREPGTFKESDRELSDMMVKYFTNFAKTGNPNGDGLPLWEDFSVDESRVLGFGDTVEMMENPYLKVYEIIDRYQAEQRQ